MTETESSWIMYGVMWALILGLLYFRHKVLGEDEQENSTQNAGKDSTNQPNQSGNPAN